MRKGLSVEKEILDSIKKLELTTGDTYEIKSAQTGKTYGAISDRPVKITEVNPNLDSRYANKLKERKLGPETTLENLEKLKSEIGQPSVPEKLVVYKDYICRIGGAMPESDLEEMEKNDTRKFKEHIILKFETMFLRASEK